MKRLINLLMALTPLLGGAQQAVRVDSEPGERWWGGATDLGTVMPFEASDDAYDLRTRNFNNQTAPLLLSSHGRYLWAEGPMTFSVDSTGVNVSTPRGAIEQGRSAEQTLRGAYLAASAARFRPEGGIPPEEFFSRPVYNTWIELMYDQNQADIMKYARNIVDHGFPTGVLMIDDNWQKDYGDWEFRPERFPDPKAMVDSLHAMGFKVMLWVCPFISADSKLARDLDAKGYLVRTRDNSDMAALRWWNGYSAAYDLSNPEAYGCLRDQFRELQTRYGIDGFKFDAGDPERYLEENVSVSDGRSFDTEQTRLWAQLAGEFPYNELRACWGMGCQPLVQRLGDKKYSWEGVSQLVPCMISAGLLGHSYACPDMIGGGEYSSFLNIGDRDFDPTLIVRSCQIHALMPVMQFSVAPWRVLDEEHLAIVRDYALLHEQFGPYIVEAAKETAATGEPIVRHMAYAFPGEGLEEVRDQYMLGSRYLVAPVASGAASRSVVLPRGRWRDENGKIYKGGRTVEIPTPLDRLPRFEKIK